LGYLFGEASAKITGTRLNLALVFTVSILPDFDLFFPGFLTHRGPTHSLFFSFLVFFPFFVVYRKKAIPYFLVLLSHSLIGDIYSDIDGGIQLFWPFSNELVSIFTLSNTSALSISFELVLFTTSTIIMVFNKDLKKMFSHEISRIYWVVPFGSVLGPLLIGVFYPRHVFPFLLVLPSLFYLALFSLLIIGFNSKKCS
jgi:membrane-bound metal-dependent hydrolase YbcI (DUF457 family)